MLGRKTLARHMVFHVTMLNHTKITLDSKVLFLQYGKNIVNFDINP
jgi:hypothetical protein